MAFIITAVIIKMAYLTCHKQQASRTR